MIPLTQERCFHHAAREAVARCPECKRYFCRECITEHEDRVVCASCLKKLSAAARGKRIRLTGLIRFGQGALGLLVCWTFFYYLGRTLLAIPSSFHEGTLWNRVADPWEEP